MPHLSFIIRYLVRPCYIADYPDFSYMEANLRGTAVAIVGSSTDRLSGVLKDYSANTKTNEAPPLPMIVGIRDDVLVYDNAGPRGTLIDFKMDTTDCHPGYTRLIPNSPRNWERSGIRWSEKGIPWLKHLPMKLPFPEKLIRTSSGLTCDCLPADAMEWVTRDRKTTWPSPSLIEAVVQCSCIVVSTAHAHSSLKDVEWQFVFNEAEQRLIASLSKPQQYCFRVLKILVDTCTKTLPIRIKTVHLKSVMFYALERISGSVWADNCGGCIMYLLSKLESHVSRKYLPNYLISSNNMIDHYSDEALSDIARRLRSIRLFPIATLVFLVESHGINQTNMLTPVIENISTFKHDKDLDKTIREAFVPGVILLAKAYLGSDEEMVGKMFQMAFKESQPSAKEHSSLMQSHPSFKEFVTEVLSKESVMARRVLAKVLDKQLNMDTSALLQDSSDVVVVKDIIDPDYTGPVADVTINRAVLHCTLTQMKVLDNLALELFMSGRPADAATLLNFAIAKTNTAKSEMIDTGAIEDPDLKADVTRQNTIKAKEVDHQYKQLCQHLSTCRISLGIMGHR